AKLSLLRHRMKNPALLARDYVKSPNIFGEARHNDGAFEDSRCCGGRSEITLCRSGQLGFSRFSEIRDRISVAWVESVKELAGTKHDAFRSTLISRPIDQPTKSRTALRLETPLLSSGFRVD